MSDSTMPSRHPKWLVEVGHRPVSGSRFDEVYADTCAIDHGCLVFSNLDHYGHSQPHEFRAAGTWLSVVPAED